MNLDKSLMTKKKKKKKSKPFLFLHSKAWKELREKALERDSSGYFQMKL